MKIHDPFGGPHYVANENRYNQIPYRRSGRSGILLPVISMGLWHNFGHSDNTETGRNILRTCFDNGITHFDLANNYGPPFGAAEENFGRWIKSDFLRYRDEMIISTKAGWDMWPGPYGNFGSRKYLLASLDQSLKRMGLDYVDIFYSHRPDPYTPLEETMGALHTAVQQGKALYVGISQYKSAETQKAATILKEMGTPCLIHQPVYNMFNRWIEDDKLLDTLEEAGMGCIVFSPLAQGILTNRYLNGIPEDSRAGRDGRYLKAEQITAEKIKVVRQLNEMALSRGQSLAQLAVAWLLIDPRITSVLIGASKTSQVEDILGACRRLDFSEDEKSTIQALLTTLPVS